MRRPVPGATSAQYSLTIRVEIDHRPGMLGKVASAIGDVGGTIGSVDLVSLSGGHTLRDITVDTAGDEHGAQIVAAIDQVDGAHVIDTTDRTLRMHVGGKIEKCPKCSSRHARTFPWRTPRAWHVFAKRSIKIPKKRST